MRLERCEREEDQVYFIKWNVKFRIIAGSFSTQWHLRDSRSVEEVTKQEAKGLFPWRWGTPGGWGNPPSRKIKRVYIQSYNLWVLGWGFLRLLLRLQLRSLSTSVPSLHLENDEILILGHVCTYPWKRYALCYAVLGYVRNHWLNTLWGIVWNMVDLQS